MKNAIIISFLALATITNAQIKVFSGGLQSYGSTTSPAYGENHHFTGDVVVSETGSTSSGCALVRANGSTNTSSVTRPDFTWLGNNQTGIFHPGTDIIGITAGGGEKFRFNSTGQILSSATQATATPAYSWTVDPNTGLYNPAADMIGFVTNGTEKFRINSSGQLLNNTATSSASVPDYSWTGSTNTGIFHSGSTFIGFSLGGTEIYRILNTGQILSSKASPSASAPDYSWNNEPGTGMYLAGTNLIGFSVNGSLKATVNNSGQILGGSGSASTPLFSWIGDANTGFFNPSPDALAVSTGGTEAMRINSSRNILMGTTGDISTKLVTSATNQAALAAVTTHSFDYGYCQANYVNRDNTKAYAVINTSTGSNVETFVVKGTGDVWGKSESWWSDRNLKENIDTLQSSLNKIKQLKGVKYNFKASFVGPGPIKTEIGLIAQDVEQVLPEVVNTNDAGLKGISYHAIIPVLIEAIKELDSKNTKLQNDLNTCCSKPSDGKNTRTTKNSDGTSSTEVTQSYMKQNKPNPFNKETVIEYNIVESGSSSILVFDMNGRLLKTILIKIPGQGSVTINASDFKAGMYYYSLIVNDVEVDTKKMILTE